MRIQEGFLGGYQVLGQSASGRYSEIYAVAGEGLPDARSIYALVLRPPSPQASRLAAQLHSDRASAVEPLPRAFVRTYDAFEHEGRPCLVTDFVAGETLAQLLTTLGGPLPPLTAIALVIELAQALAEAHQQRDGGGRPLVHGDLCPANVLLGYDGRIRILDFGRALTEARLTGDPRAGQPHAGYFSPERAQSVRDVEPRSDVYSLGLILYELLSGAPAISGNDEASRLERAKSPKIPPISSKARVGELLEDLLRRALNPVRNDRLKGAKEMAGALTALKGGKLASFNTRTEVEKLILHHYAHRARAMRTLLARWTGQIASEPTGDLGFAPSSRPASGRSPAPRPRSLPPALEARPLAEPVVTLDVVEALPTSDLPGPERALLVPRRLSFVGGVLLCGVGAALLIATVPFWPGGVQASALVVGERLAAAGSTLLLALARWLTQLAG